MIILPVLSQQQNPEIRRFTKDNALSHNIIEEVFQDEKGFMWFGTYDGLARFDGYSVKYYKYNHLDKNSISNDVITSMVQDDAGVLWIGTHMGLNSYDPSTEKFTRYYASQLDTNSLISNQILSLMIDNNGFLWIGTYFGLSIMDLRAGHNFANYPNPMDPLDPSTVQINTLFQLNDSIIWVAASSGLSAARISGNDYADLDFTVEARLWDAGIRNAINIVRDHNGIYWIRSGNSIAIYREETGEVLRLPARDLIFSQGFSFLTSDRAGNIWIGIDNRGFIKLDPDKLYSSATGMEMLDQPLKEGEDYTLYHLPSTEGSEAAFNRVRSSWFDSSGLLWIGTHDGVFNLDLSTKPFNWYCRFANDNTTLCDDITSVTANSNGEILFGTSNYTLFRFDQQSHQTEMIPLNQPGNLMVSAIYTDPYEYTWLGVTGGGVIKLDPSGSLVKRYNRETPDSVRLDEWAVWCLIEDRNENLWVGTASGLEKFKLSPAVNGNREFLSKKKYVKNINDSGALKSGNIWALFEDNSGRIWVAEHMGGLGLYKPEKDNFKTFEIDRESPSALQSNKIQVIVQDHRGIIWLGTEYGFVAMRCDETDHAEFRTFTENDGLCNNGITGILEDPSGDLWISTKGGLSRFSPPELVFDRSEQGKFMNYYASDGLQSDKFNPFAYAGSKSGEMFFGGSQGLSVFHPDSMVTQELHNKVVLTGFSISNSEVRAGDTIGGRFIFEKSISYTDQITLSHRENAVTFQFSGMDFVSPENVNYAFLLEGFDNEWNYFGSGHRFATYTNLPPDEYRFRVKVTNSNQTVSGPETTLELTILTPYWQTWWFKVLGVLLFTGIVISYFRYRTFKLKKQREILRRQVRERTTELEYANTQLEVTNEEILTQKEHIENQSKILERQNKNLKLLDEIGQNITSAIRVKEIISRVYDHINELMDASVFYIGIVDREQRNVKLWGRTDKHNPLKTEIISLDNEDRFSAWCINQNKIVLMNDVEKEISNFLSKDVMGYTGEKMPRSSIYIPLVSIDKSVSGLLVIKSFRRNSYSDMHMDILKNMANYISIALDNARSYQVIEEKSEKLSQMDKIKTRFFTNISHEFRTPLTLILSPVRNMIRKEVMKDDKLMDELALVERNAERLLRLINQLLEISRIEGETLKLKVRKGNLVESIERIAEPFYLHSNYKSISLTVNSELKTLHCYFDYDKIEKILYNILSNAIKYTPDNGKVNLSLKVIREAQSIDYARITVSDTGIGIPEAEFDRIFERFAQIDDSRTQNIPGTGIGLSLAKKLTELHKGEISVQSTDGKGSKFTVQIPVSKSFYSKDEVLDDEVIFEKRHQGQKALSYLPDRWLFKRKPHNKELKTLLIVEDNPDICHYLGSQFEKRFNIQVAVNGREGLEKALLTNPDLAICDIMMPEMNGIELCRQMKTNEATSHIPIILLTARADEKLRKTGYDTGADDYVIKPFDIDILEKRVDNLIRSREEMKSRFYSGIVPDAKSFSPTITDEKLLRKILGSIEDNISNSEFNIDTLIREVGISRAQLFRKIKSLTNNQSVSDFIITYRLQRAAQLFSKGHQNVSEVAYNVGFKNTSHFTTRFKKQFGKAPKEYMSSI